jgi:hypothetical protein
VFAAVRPLGCVEKGGQQSIFALRKRDRGAVGSVKFRSADRAANYRTCTDPAPGCAEAQHRWGYMPEPMVRVDLKKDGSSLPVRAQAAGAAETANQRSTLSAPRDRRKKINKREMSGNGIKTALRNRRLIAFGACSSSSSDIGDRA